MSFITDRKFVSFVIKFIVIFCILYYGTLFMIGIAAPGGTYSAFVDKHLDYVSGIKNLLLLGTQKMLLIFGIKTQIEPNFTIRVIHGRGVFIAMDCVGYGVYSFWLAYVLANVVPAMKKTIWALGGVLLLFFINNIRIALFLVAINKGWAMPLGLDHHTWFNIFAYLAIFTMIYFFEKSISRNKETRVAKAS